MRIPVFVSCPTSLSPEQESRRKVVVRELDRLALEPRALGRSDYPTNLPLRVHPIPRVGLRGAERQALEEVFLKWGSRVREHYYD